MFELSVFLLFLFIIYLQVQVSDLKKKVGQGSLTPADDAHTKTIAAKQGSDIPPQSKYSDLPHNSGTQAQQPHVHAHTHTTTATEGFSFWRWLTTDWLLKLGALLLILALGWFVSYAFGQNWIGPMGRIAFGYIVGATILVSGFWRSQRNTAQGTIIMTLGSAAILITTYAAREVYDFFTPVTALALMSLVTAFMAYSSVKDKLLSRALISLIIGCIAPFLTVSATPSVSGLFMYLFVLIAASIWIVAITGWKELLVASTGVYAIFSIPFFYQLIPSSEKSLLVVIISAFVILFYGVGFISALRTKEVKLTDIFIKIMSLLLFVGWVQLLVNPEWKSLVMVLASVLTALAAWSLQLQTANKWLVVLHTSISLVYLTVAATFELDGPAVLLAYIALVTIAAWLAGIITKNFKVGQLFGIPYLYVFLLLIGEISNRSVSWSALLVTGTLAVVLLVMGAYWYHETHKKGFMPAVSELTVIYLYASLLVSVIFIWSLFEKTLFSREMAHGFALVVYTLVGVLMYGYGMLESWQKTRFAGGVLVALVIVRLFLVEIWNMSLASRIIVFALVGVLLMLVAFLRPKQKA